MTSREIRNTFIDFFTSKQHKAVPSAPVIPHGDPTLLFTNAGMNQFKDVFLGIGSRDYKRAVDTQKCIRVSGKHNDLEEVGVDTYHHTLFEMLGNWSFGDYYKEEAIAWAWELLTEVWKLPKDRLYATVFRTDDEAYQIWKKYLPEDHIQRFDEKDNFWEVGETGPCGPCSEIHFDGTIDKSGAPLVNASSPEVIEIWNLVFIQYNRKADGSLEELSAKHVDTGMGFERITRVLQGKNSNYDTDIFMPIINEIERLSGRKYSTDLENKDAIAMRVIADHIRTISFAIADGAFPGNEGRGYVLRRILRRAERFARNLGFKEPVLYKLVAVLIDVMGDFFKELVEHRNIIERVIKSEEDSFLTTLDNGLQIFNDITSKADFNGTIQGEIAFQLYDTYGFPLDLTELLARENGFGVDIDGFNESMKKQKERSRAARKSTNVEAETEDISFVTGFVGYDNNSHESKVLHIKDNKIILEQTPFYAESGGQISDAGIIKLGGIEYQVEDVRKVNNAIIHYCYRELENLVGQTASLQIDVNRRNAIRRNHSATHLMHEALRRTLGTHLQQQGSLVSPDYLRFDINHFEKISKEDIQKVEDIVNQKILENHKVQTKVLPIEEAQKLSNVKMFFGDKYGDTVRVVVIDDKFSMEFCGGTHANSTSEIGLFKIISEGSVAAGIRRIEAISGNKVMEYISDLHTKLNDKESEIEELERKNKSLEKQILDFKISQATQKANELLSSPKDVNGVNVVVSKFDIGSAEILREVTENMTNKASNNTVILTVCVIGDKINLACGVTNDLISKYNAGKLIGSAAKFVGGGGGGRPNFATAGGKDLNKLDELLNSEFYNYIQQ